jgi:hypothetical protein
MTNRTQKQGHLRKLENRIALEMKEAMEREYRDKARRKATRDYSPQFRSLINEPIIIVGR